MTTIPPALKHRRYRLLWSGLLLSIAGSQMQAAAILWHVNGLDPRPIALAGVGAARILPVLLLSLPAGAIVDVFNRRRLMLVTQTLLALLALSLAAITLAGEDRLPPLYALIAASAAAGTLDLPARQSLVPSLVPRDDLPSAFSLNSIAFHFGSIAGPALGGLVLGRWGIGAAYLINAVSYLGVLAALAAMGPVEHARTAAGESARAALRPARLVASVREGLSFVFSQPIILSGMLLDFLATFFSSATALLPIFAREILAVGAQGYGWLVAAPSVGAAAAALSLTLVRRLRRQGPILLISVAVFGAATIVFGLSRAFWLTFSALAITGAADGVSTILRNTIRQLQTPDSLRGRMTSVNQVFFMGGPQLGELEAGLVAQWLGAPASVVTGGLGCLVAAAWVARRFPALRAYDGAEAGAALEVASAAGPAPAMRQPNGDRMTGAH
ncbi:MAG: MFS transporter [Anaerolineales bacterium]